MWYNKIKLINHTREGTLHLSETKISRGTTYALVIFDLIVSIVVTLKIAPSNLHLLLKIGIIVVMFLAAFLIMNITKFGIGLVAITAVSLLFAWVINGIVIAPYVEDTIWKWILRVCSLLICFLGHLKLTVWNMVIKEKFSK